MNTNVPNYWSNKVQDSLQTTDVFVHFQNLPFWKSDFFFGGGGGGSSNIQKFIQLHQPEISQVVSAMPLLLCDINVTVRKSWKVDDGWVQPILHTLPHSFRAHLRGYRGARQLAGIVQVPTTTPPTN